MNAAAKAIVHNDKNESVADREVVIERVFDAPARLLFLAYSKAEHLRQWFGPKGYPLTRVEMDFRVGGLYRFAMTGPDGKQGPLFGGEYLEIVANEKIVYTNGFLADDAPTPTTDRMLLTITFKEKAGKTTLTIHTLFGSIEMKNTHVGYGYVMGVNSGIDQLVDVVAALQTGGAQ